MDAHLIHDIQAQMNQDIQLLLRFGFMDYSLLISVSWLPSSTLHCDACSVGTLPVREPGSSRTGIVKVGIIDLLQV